MKVSLLTLFVTLLVMIFHADAKLAVKPKSATANKAIAAGSKSNAKAAAAAAGGVAAAANKAADKGVSTGKGGEASLAVADADDQNDEGTASTEQTNSKATSTEQNNVKGQKNNDSKSGSATSTAASATRTRPCDQGDQSLAAGLTANSVVGLGEQASVLSLQGLVSSNGNQQDISAAMTRLEQFINSSVHASCRRPESHSNPPSWP